MIYTSTYGISQGLKRSKNFINKDLNKAKNNNNFYILDFIQNIIDKDLNKYDIIEYTSKKLLHNEKVYKFLNTILFDGQEYYFNNDLVLEISKKLGLYIKDI